MISIIVAISENNAIGQKGGLLCHLPADLKHFKSITSGHPVLMGERTFYSLPVRPLPNRRNIVLTDNPDFHAEGVEVVHSIPEALQLITDSPIHQNISCSGSKPDDSPEVFIIGGGMVYRQFFPLADKLYITHIHHTWEEADTFFPEVKPDEWRRISEELHFADEKNPFDYTFAEYVR
ncbi:MAG: dihydrofolate reductase [Paludibacteraceae bacterium]|nr:dihydrofolate reductase [Paludibacteraceae bacterium]